MFNHVSFMGRFTKAPELRATQSGTSVCSFSLACDRDYKGTNGEKETDFFDCVAWRKTAEFVSKYFNKGQLAVVEGRLQNRDWKDKEGNKRRSTEIVVDNVYFADSKSKDSEPPEYSGNPMGKGTDEFGIPDGFDPGFGNA